MKEVAKEITKVTQGKYSFIEADKRVIERNLRRHLLRPSEHQKLLKGLSDDQQNMEEQIVYTAPSSPASTE